MWCVDLMNAPKAKIDDLLAQVSPFVFNKILDSAPGLHLKVCLVIFFLCLYVVFVGIGVLWAVAILNFLCCFTLLGVGPLKAESGTF